MTPQSVEIERLLITLENLNMKGGSLESSLLERLMEKLLLIDKKADESEEQVYLWWNDLTKDFTILNEDYHDYIRELNSINSKNLMKTKEFLVFKEHFVEYLHKFIYGLQKNVGVIEGIIKDVSRATLEKIFNKIISYELSIPRLNSNLTESMIRESVLKIDKEIGRASCRERV